MTADLHQELEILEALERGPIYHFRDWPNLSVPLVAAGVYTVWRGASLIYVGMAGRSLNASDIMRHRVAERVKTGLSSRLNAHASGRRSGDKFCVYVSDRLVLPTLTRGQIASIAKGETSLDDLVRRYIREHLSYRFVEVPDGATARRIEGLIRRGALSAGKPFLNAAAQSTPRREVSL